jgi:hypothetical protein
MLARLKAVWHDPVWSKVISVAILAVAATAWAARGSIMPVASGALAGAWGWLWADVKVPRGSVLLLILGLQIASLGAYLWLGKELLRRIGERAVENYKKSLQSQSPPPIEVSPESVRVDAEAFPLNKLRFSALLVLLNRINQQTSLEQLYIEVETQLERNYEKMPAAGKAQLARDMEDAERASIVSMDRLGSLQPYYRLTTHGRDWLLDELERLRDG